MRIAVIGCGEWGPNHIRVFKDVSGVNVVAAVDLAEERLARVRQTHPEIRCERDAAVVLGDPEVDAVVVATPTSTHFRLVEEALVAGKHVLCEKPLAMRAAEAQALVRLADDVGRVLMVGHVFLFNAGVSKVKELVAAGELGRVLYLAASRTNLGPIRDDVDVAFDLASHDIAIFNWLLEEEPELVSAVGGAFLRPGVEDVVFATLRYPSGAVASMRASWLDPKKVRQMTVVGTTRMLTWDDLVLSTPVAIYDKGVATEWDYDGYDEFLRLSMWDGDVRLPQTRIVEPLKQQALAFVDAAATGAPPRSDGRFGAGVVAVLEAVRKSLDEQGAPTAVAPDAVRAAGA